MLSALHVLSYSILLITLWLENVILIGEEPGGSKASKLSFYTTKVRALGIKY